MRGLVVVDTAINLPPPSSSQNQDYKSFSCCKQEELRACLEKLTLLLKPNSHLVALIRGLMSALSLSAAADAAAVFILLRPPAP